jgi:hypothetical protein
MSCIILRGRWCDIDWNVRAPAEDETDDTKDSFYKELEPPKGKKPLARARNRWEDNIKTDLG